MAFSMEFPDGEDFGCFYPPRNAVKWPDINKIGFLLTALADGVRPQKAGQDFAVNNVSS